MTYLQKIAHTIKKLLAPPFCLYCRSYMSDYVPLCKQCASYIKPIISAFLSIGSYRMQVHAAGAYEEPLKTFVLAKSWSDYSAATKLGDLVYQFSNVQDLNFDYIVPVPLHAVRQAARGYNQVEVLAHIISKRCNKPMLDCLKRRKNSPFQAAFPPAERHENVQGAFSITAENALLLEGKRVLLLDDVMTTGSTLYEAGKVLLSCKPQHVEALVACRAIS